MQVFQLSRTRILLTVFSFCLCCIVSEVFGQLYYNAPNASAYNPLTNKYFISNQGSGEIFQIDRSGNKWLFSKGLASPRNLAFERLPMGWTLMVLDSNRMVIYDTAGSVLGYETISGIGQIQDCVYDSVDRILYTTDRQRGAIYKTIFSTSAPYTFKTTVWVSGLIKPSALILQKSRGRLLLVQDTTNSGLISVSLKDSSAQLLRYLNLSNVMGLAEDEQGNLYFSAVAEQYIYQLNKYYKGSPKALIREPKPGDLTMVSKRNEWVYTCMLCGKVYVAALHLFGPSSEIIACAGDSVDTYKNPFLKNIGTFELGNEFILELSDAFGDFIRGYELGRVSDTLIPASISGVIPKDLPAGMGYRVRWSSTKPGIRGWLEMSEISPRPALRLSKFKDTLFDCGGKGLRLRAQDSFELADFTWYVNNKKIVDSTLYLSLKTDSINKVVLFSKLASSGCSSSDSVWVIRATYPELVDWGTSVSACQGDSVLLGDTVVYRPNLQYRWTSPGWDSSWVDYSVNPKVQARWTDSFFVTVQNLEGCSSDKYQVVEVTTRDSVRWWKVSDSVIEVVSQKGGKITWFKDGVKQSYSDSRWQNPDTGVYLACTQVDMGCIHCTDTFRVQSRRNGVFNLRGKMLTVRPNPSVGVFYLDGWPVADWQVFSLQGQLLLTGKGNAVDLGQLLPGMYVLRTDVFGSILLHKSLL